MKKRIIFIALLTIMLVGCSGEYGIKNKETSLPYTEKTYNNFEENSFADVNEQGSFEKYNLPISKDIYAAFLSYQQFCICIKCLLKV